MYERLARGHATAYIDGLQDYSTLVNWLDGPRLARATNAFEKSSFAKKPGRVLKRMTPPLRPCFGQPYIRYWSRNTKAVSAKGIASTTENHVFRLPEDTRPLYSERAVFMTDILFTQRFDRIRAGVMTSASISRHAIARLVERGAVDPEDMVKDIFVVLDYCATFAERTIFTEVDHTVMQSFMLPFLDGALVAVFMDMDPARTHKGEDRHRVLSVRTWLSDEMLSEVDLERMAGLEDVTRTLFRAPEAGVRDFQRWLEANARPWRFADSTIGDQARDVDAALLKSGKV